MNERNQKIIKNSHENSDGNVTRVIFGYTIVWFLYLKLCWIKSLKTDTIKHLDQ